MQIVSNGDNLHEMSNLVFCFLGKIRQNTINYSSAELAQRVETINTCILLLIIEQVCFITCCCA